MKLAILDNEGNVVLTFPDPSAAHTDIAEAVAEAVFPGRFQAKRRAKAATAVRAHLISLQQQTVRL